MTGQLSRNLRGTNRTAGSPVSFSEDCFRPPSDIGGFVSFGQEEEVDLMSISASEREDWAGSEADQLDSAGTPNLQEELMRVLSKAVQELELTWSPPEEPARSKLDSWMLTVESIIERFAEAQKHAKAMSHVMPRRAFQQQTAGSRSSSAHGPSYRRDNPRPATVAVTATAPRQEPDVRRKAWGPGRKRHGQRRSPRRDSRPKFVWMFIQ
ncbi:hypothetical protein Q8A67_015681 [Cirrhinus molitorella]|uniref:Uncharacterized protein n=1 Tax=Cirrhinus molitorella TaxID=172907 RepID=A0AA88PF71_9TELE|nr:hypothetical protein Q8A67_015681 [Cirrhinus molitorella]